MNSRLRPIILLAALTLTILFGETSQARESYFKPISNEIVSTSANLEGALTEISGGFELWSNSGDLLPGFPSWVDSMVLSSSPIAADMNGNGSKEILVLGRSAGNAYTLYAFDAAGNLLSSAPISGEEVYYEPAVSTLGAKSSIVISTNDGDLIRYDYVGTDLTPTTLLSGSGSPRAINISTDNKIFVSSPSSNSITIYKDSGSDAWVVEDTISTSSPVIYPITFGSGDVVYAVTANNKLLAFNKVTGNSVSGFPVSLGQLAIGSPQVVELDPDSEGLEIVIQLADKTRRVFSKEGGALSITLAQKSFPDYSQFLSTTQDSDLDLDGLINDREFALGTYPNYGDTDLDGTLDGADVFPLDASESADADLDGIGDNADPDDDNDSIADTGDTCPSTPFGDLANASGCACSQISIPFRDCLADRCVGENFEDYPPDGSDACLAGVLTEHACSIISSSYSSSCDPDDDDDGIADASDTCPETPAGESANTSGCSCSQLLLTAHDCPSDACNENNWEDYPDDGSDTCTNGIVSLYSCTIVSSAYSDTCAVKTVSTFGDGSSSVTLSFEEAGDKTIYVSVPRNASVRDASLKVEGRKFEEDLWSQNHRALLDGEDLNAYFNGVHIAILDLADIDNDGDLDLFVGGNSGTILFYRNDGSASSPIWTLVSEVYAGIRAGFSAHPKLADIDADGDLDLFIGEHFGKILFYRNEGTAEEALWTKVTDHYANIDVGFLGRLSFGDVDADGDLDMMIGQNRGYLYFYRNDGSPEIADWTLVSNRYLQEEGLDWNFEETHNYLMNTAPELQDLDGDGDLDLLIGNLEGSFFYFKNEGDIHVPNWVLQTKSYKNLDPGLNTSPRLVDLDADGDLDLLSSVWEGHVFHYENTGDSTTPTWEEKAPLALGIDVGYVSDPTFTDMDADGDQDLFIGAHFDRLWYYENEGSNLEPNWTFKSSNYAGIDSSLNPSGPEFVDIDADGDFDLFLGQKVAGGISFYQNIGNETNASWSLSSENYAEINVGQGSSPAFADLDDDGDADLLVGNAEGTLSYYRNEGSASLASWSLVSNSFGAIDAGSYSSPTLVDIDLDGDFDLFIGNWGGSLYFYENEGSPETPSFTYRTRNFANANFQQGSNPSFTDIDADGDPDLFLGSREGGLRFFRYTPTAPLTNPSLDLGNDGFSEWFKEGSWEGAETSSDLSTQINAYLSSDPAASVDVSIPIVVHSDSVGILHLSDLVIQYTTP